LDGYSRQRLEYDKEVGPVRGQRLKVIREVGGWAYDWRKERKEKKVPA